MRFRVINRVSRRNLEGRGRRGILFPRGGGGKREFRVRQIQLPFLLVYGPSPIFGGGMDPEALSRIRGKPR